MSEGNLSIAVAYYTAMANRNIDEMSKCLHSEAVLVSPLDVIEGKEEILKAANRFIALFKKLTIRAKCRSEDQAMLAIDLDFSLPIGIIRTAVLVSFKEELIVNIELFFNPQSLEPNKDET